MITVDYAGLTRWDTSLLLTERRDMHMQLDYSIGKIG